MNAFTRLGKRAVSLLLLALFLCSYGLVFAESPQYFDEVRKENYDPKTTYANWEAVAVDMGKAFNNAIYAIGEGNLQDAYDNVNFAYFGFYEVQGFEATVLSYLSRKRVKVIESAFRHIKFSLLGQKDVAPEQIQTDIRDLAIKVYKDAMVLDKIAEKDDADDLGLKLYSHIPDPLPHLSASGDVYSNALELAKQAENAGMTELGAAILANIPQEIKDAALATTEPVEAVETVAENEEAAEAQEETVVQKRWYDFLFSTDFNTAFWLLIREGLEAILVVVAIVAYLIKTNNRHYIKHIYYGCLIAVVTSVLLAMGILHFIQNVLDQGVIRELIEGWTMFLAVLVLFYVSNWILTKSETQAWENYIDGMVSTSLDKNNKRTLMFAAFLAVFREGAELVLFYTAAFSGGQSNGTNIALGILLALVLLIIVWVLFRYTSVKLPIKAFFRFTSALLFLLCVSFMGKGVIELTEAGVIQGGTVIPAMNGFTLDALSIYDRAETLIPQIMIVIAAVAIYWNHWMKSRKAKAEAKAEAKA